MWGSLRLAPFTNSFEFTYMYSFSGLLEMMCYSLYDALRPVVIHINHLETLADMCSILQVYAVLIRTYMYVLVFTHAICTYVCIRICYTYVHVDVYACISGLLVHSHTFVGGAYNVLVHVAATHTSIKITFIYLHNNHAQYIVHVMPVIGIGSYLIPVYVRTCI